MPRSTPEFEVVQHPLEVRLLEVVAVQQLTPKMRRIRLQGPSLSTFANRSPEDHVKLFFPHPGENMPRVPRLVVGRLVPPSGGRVHARDYTPLSFDAERCQVEFDFYLHGRGVAARWAQSARVSDRLGMAGPRGSLILRKRFGQHVFIGDETALPEFRERMKVLPATTQLTAVLLVDGPAEEQPLPRNAKVHWVHRENDPESGQLAMKRRLIALAPFDDDTFFWLAGEARDMRSMLSILDGSSVSRSRIRASGHWKRGVENHDHHSPLEDTQVDQERRPNHVR